jgi:hypothetical protein
MEKKYTERGFGYYEFTDRFGFKCSLQNSSIACEEAHIWFGVDENNKGIVKKSGENKEYPGRMRDVTSEELDRQNLEVFSRMHLSQSQVKELLPHLIRFVEEGEV